MSTANEHGEDNNISQPTIENADADSQKEKQYALNFYPNDRPLSKDFVNNIRYLEDKIKRRVFVMLDGYGEAEFKFKCFTAFTYYRVVSNKNRFPSEPIAVLLDSFGGSGQIAFKLANLIRSKCKSYCVIVHERALSAATLFALGAETICLGDEAVLGPLDAQIYDPDIEEDVVSALDTVKAVSQLEDSAIEVALNMLRHLQHRTGKKSNLLLKPALHFAAEITRPLFNKIDAIKYSRHSRILQEAQDYAERLLQPQFSAEKAKAIAHDLVRRYPTHDFVINIEESRSIGTISDKNGETKEIVGLHVDKKIPEDIRELLDWFLMNTYKEFGVGFVDEISNTEK